MLTIEFLSGDIILSCLFINFDHGRSSMCNSQLLLWASLGLLSLLKKVAFVVL